MLPCLGIPGGNRSFYSVRCGARRMILLLVCVLGIRGDRDEDVHNMKIMSAQEIVERVVDSAQSHIDAREVHLGRCKCANHTCSNDNSVWAECAQSLGTDGMCHGYCPGMRVNFEHSGIRTPPGADPERLKDNVVESICLHQDMDNIFQELAAAGAVNTWTYFGSTAGVMRTWPSKARERALTSGSYDPKLGNCRTYEPRLRPWYTETVTSAGPKDLIILLDTSGTMSSSSGALSRISIALDVVSTLLAYTSSFDHIAIVPFGSEPKTLVSNELIRATTPNMHTLLDAGRATALNCSGKSNLAAAFEKAFEVLRNSMNGYKTSDCQRMIFLLSDGHFCEDPKNGMCQGISYDYQNIQRIIETEQIKLEDQNADRASVFTLSIGRNSRNGLMRQISCGNGGTWAEVTDMDDPLVKLTSYVSVLTSKRNNNDLVWSGFYIDDSGLGEMTTAALPVFTFNTTGSMKGELVGVVGHDIPLSQFQSRGVSYAEVLGTVTNRISTCNMKPLGTCPLQVVRGSMSQCPGILHHGLCYREESTGHIYHSAHETLTQKEAAESCKALGGYLIDLTSDEEIGLAGGMAAASGSWIGLHCQDETHWVWQRGETKLVNASSLWAPGFQDLSGDCASVDRRGARQNVVRNNCLLKLHYICEFDSMSDASSICKSNNVVDFEGAHFETIPSVLQCLERFGEPGDVAKEAAKRSSSGVDLEVLCPLGNFTSTEDLVCIKGCSDIGHQTSEGSRVTGLTPFFLIVNGLIWICLMAIIG